MLDREKRIALFYTAIGLSALLLFASFHPLDWNMLAWMALGPMLLASSTFTRYRDVFAIGAVQAAAWVAGKPAQLYSMKDVLGL